MRGALVSKQPKGQAPDMEVGVDEEEDATQRPRGDGWRWGQRHSGVHVNSFRRPASERQNGRRVVDHVPCAWRHGVSTLLGVNASR